MSGAEYVKRVREAADREAADAVVREAWAATQEKRITVAEWNAVWIAHDRIVRPWQYIENNWTGD